MSGSTSERDHESRRRAARSRSARRRAARAEHRPRVLAPARERRSRPAHAVDEDVLIRVHPCPSAHPRRGVSRATSLWPSWRGSAAPAWARPAACGSGAARARRRGPPPRRGRARSSSWSSEPGVLVDLGRRVPLLLQPRRDRVQSELGGLDVGDLVPVERAADAGVGDGPHRVARGDRAVAGVLVVVDEDAVALLLPPLAGGALRARGARPRGPAPARPAGRRRSPSAARSGR